ncbi:polysaccharide lyase family 1 protein [Dothidotthia symphoricarpi CBS 119687]|uniref:Polysaccharide lyase family 1 protein n=1 Tax=Dothidotthia symphoricarpi CBS 119687 TaxID=1392245 RepID=A0A6A6A7C2_9PLEO|nr:polysaccharide lyase family 1 protein [Dothidotthia symphoricarpi CBS 119687]KAF2127759.1 polysaccharide lyase family 1 protein [Dothidotthia symphoricarpi CBS 119687]
MKPLVCLSLFLTAVSSLKFHDSPRGLQDTQIRNETTANIATRIRLNPAKIRDSGDKDFLTWTVPNAASTKLTVKDTSLSLSLSVASGKLGGNYNKAVYTRIGISTENDNGDNVGGAAITLTIQGLSTGEHSLLTWHNAWDALKETASVNVTVNGGNSVSGIAQSVRVDNIWEAAASFVTFSAVEGQAIEIVFAPDSSGDGRVFLNGFQIDSPNVEDQISFPEPAHQNERIEVSGDGEKSVRASWKAAQARDAVYNVYLGTSPTTLKTVATSLSETSTTLQGLNSMDSFYWRVDVITNNKTSIGRTWTFRVAQLAFPEAEGYGRYARGGRGGQVIHVTSLEDSEAEGTLRYALTIANGPRIVVFDVGGVITTKSRMTVQGQYITVAGQTAPGKGIVVQGYPLGLSGATDVIFRHLRVFPGKVSNQTIDGMGMQGSNFCIFDRCSMGWTIDETFSSRDAHNITLQRSMISEPLNIAGHKNYPVGTQHGYAASIGGEVGSFHHNLIAHAEGRSWSMAGGVDDEARFAGMLDIRNNVVYNFGDRVTDGGAHQAQFVSNLYKKGPASTRTYAFRAQYEDDMPGTQQYFCEGNAMPGVFSEDSEQYVSDGTGKSSNVACWADVTIGNVTYQKFVPEPWFESHVETQSATEAYKRVLSDSGASQPVQDDHDKRIVHETLNGNTTYTGSVGKKHGIIDNPADVGGLEDFPSVSRPSSWDADGDGIADWWDGSTGGDGYTSIEGYLNFMADPHSFVAPSTSVEIDLGVLAAGFVKPSFSIDGATKGSVKVSGGIATYTAMQTGVDRLTISIEDETGSKWTRIVGVAIFEGANDI